MHGVTAEKRLTRPVADEFRPLELSVSVFSRRACVLLAPFPPRPLLRRIFTPALLGASVIAVSGSAGGAPPPVATAPPKAVVVAPEPPPDVSAVPEPAGLVLVGRVSKAEGILKTLGTWTRLPLPGGADLVRSMTDDSVAEAVDLSQPIDGAVALRGGKRDMNPLIAVSVAVRSFDDAKAKLGAKHKLTPGKNGQINVEGIGRSAVTEGRGKAPRRGRRRQRDVRAVAGVLGRAARGAGGARCARPPLSLSDAHVCRARRGRPTCTSR